jgi:hypothetical protein
MHMSSQEIALAGQPRPSLLQKAGQIIEEAWFNSAERTG